MLSHELTPKQAVSIETPETAAMQFPPIETHLETARLDSNRPNLPELGAELEAAAKRVTKKGDNITAPSQFLASRLLAISAVAFNGEYAFIDAVTHSGTNAASVGVIVGTTSVAVGKAIIDKKASTKVTPIQIPEGYSIQCLRANKTSSEFDDREAVAFVHSRKYEDGKQQTTDQARDRLRDALTVIEAAPTVTKVVLPISVLRGAQLPYQGDRPYRETILDMELDAQTSDQYEDDEMSAVLTREASKRLVEVLGHAHNHPLLHRTVDALAERFPLLRLQLAEAANDNERLVPLLHTLLRRTLDGELPGAQRERGHNGRTYYDHTEPLLTQIDTTNKFDPLITQHRATNYAPIETKRLSHMTGGNEQLTANVLDRLESRGYSDLHLVSVALRLAEVQHKEEAIEAPASAQVVQTDLLIGSDPIAIHINPESHTVNGGFLGRSLGRIAVAGLAGAFIAQGVATGMNAYLPKPPGVVNEASTTWRVDEHGMTSTGYYTRTTFDHFDASTVQWDGKEGFKWLEPLPTTLQDPGQDHLTVSGVTNSSDVDLPIRAGTSLGAISARTEEGQEIKLNVYIRGDNTRAVHVENNANPYKLSYELTPDTQHKQAPFADRIPNVTDPSWHGINPSSFPYSKKMSAPYVARYIADEFTYDASTSLQGKLSKQHTADDYLHAVYDGGRCNCVECATAAALLTERVQPDQALLLGTGYLNDATPGVGHSYLESSEAHAWLIDASGSIIDATAQKIDKNSNVPVHTPVAEMDTQLKDGGWSTASKDAADTAAKAATAANQNKPSPWNGLESAALTGLGVLAAAGLWREARKRTITNGALTLVRTGQWLTSAVMIAPDKAATAMAWHAYSNGKTPMPSYKPGQRTPLVDNISTTALQEIASGALRTDPQLSRSERHGTRRMAKLLLAERQRNEK